MILINLVPVLFELNIIIRLKLLSFGNFQVILSCYAAYFWNVCWYWIWSERNGEIENKPTNKLKIENFDYFQALLYTHDKIAGRDYEPIIMPDSYDVEDDDEMVKIVQLVKRDEPLVS